jgi:hypothetical protein
MSPIVASSELIGVRANGERFTILLRIGQPYERAGETTYWSCPVSLQPLYPNLADQSGVDFFQALCLASRLAITLLGGFKEDGRALLNSDGTEFPLEAYARLKP